MIGRTARFFALSAALHAASPAAARDLPACFGTAFSMTVTNMTPVAPVGLGNGVSGRFSLDYGMSSSRIEMSALPRLRPDGGPCPLRGPANCEFNTFMFGGMWRRVLLKNADVLPLAAAKGVIGVIGTDFLSRNVYTLRYGEGKFLRSSSKSFCSPEVLRASGFLPLSAAGFLSADYKSLKPMTALDAASTTKKTVPDSPIVPIRVAGVPALGELDTGFVDNLYPHSLEVNRALFDRIEAHHPGALVRRPEFDVSLEMCGGRTERAESYWLPAEALDLVDEDGRAARSWPSAYVFVSPNARTACGGVGTWTVPAAQIGADYYIELDTIVFDPFAGRVWVRGAPAAP